MITPEGFQRILIVVGFLWVGIGAWNFGKRNWLAGKSFMAAGCLTLVLSVVVGTRA